MKIKLVIIIRLLSMMLLLIGAILSFQKELYYTFSVALFLILILIIEVYFKLNQFFLLYNKVVLAILNEDYSVSFQEKDHEKTKLNLIKLYNQSKKNHNELATKDTIYTSIFNEMKSGIMILKIDENEKKILFMNDYFFQHFEVPLVSKWENLTRLFPDFCNYLENLEFENHKNSLDIKTKGKGTQTYSIHINNSLIFNHKYVTILIDSIQSVIEKKEKASWINLMKVISHELFNSLTPIHSLTENMIERTANKSLNNEDWDDLHLSLVTISNRSKHLKQFIESYRKLTTIQSPIKTTCDINQMITQTIFLFQDNLQKQKISIETRFQTEKKLQIDKQQIEQVLVNLLLNSIYALEDQYDKKIIISTHNEKNRVYIIFSDNGIGIENAIKDKIFLPFFTTRKDGVGIGLTFSKTIIEAHGGYMFFEQNENETRFVVVL
jgi:two-component system, NtrC family, nitrogen regulation sensor histidine kinase NtrY